MEAAARSVANRLGTTLRQVASELKRLGYTAPKGGTEWALSTIKLLLDRAKQTGMLIDR